MVRLRVHAGHVPELGGFKNPDASKPVGPSARVAGRYVAFFLNGVGGSGVARL